MNPVLKAVVGVLAVVGALSVIGAAGMAFMHFSMLHVPDDMDGQVERRPAITATCWSTRTPG